MRHGGVCDHLDQPRRPGRSQPVRRFPAGPWFHDVATRYRRHRRYRQTVAALAELDDRILADIGVGRHEIEDVAWAMSRKAL
jgi:uncharacterized protein YjiS (DUF1127 family)